MDVLLNFLADNYIWFMIGAGVLLIALVGFVVDGKKKKETKEDVPQNTVNMNQMDAVNQMQNNAAVPTQSNPDQSIVFEQPSMVENETINELNSANAEPSLTFESANESQPVDFNNLTGNATVASTENVNPNETMTIGEPIEAPASPVNNELVVDTPSVLNVDTPAMEPITPVVESTPIVNVETPAMEPIAPVVESAPIVNVESPVIEPVANVQEVSMEIPTVQTIETPTIPVVETPAEQTSVTPSAPEIPVGNDSTTPIA